ncbi:hypothetical protein MN116_008233 [Schistosoma mekongi]|uniref:Small ribosomal subunit protein mS33 n=1 Tax=Schistosoma mekongi TaxID=38744 RepID=A0AAE1Z6J5_SCHME|nr:hypothetical protein MN116_008233 [Schistosoma mekongi]
MPSFLRTFAKLLDTIHPVLLSSNDYINLQSSQYKSMTSLYAKKMTLLAGRIFKDVGIQVDSKSMKVVRIMSELPRPLILKDYYPALEEYSNILQKLRYLGLYRDEHADFREEMDRLRELRGKGKRKRGENTNVFLLFYYDYFKRKDKKEKEDGKKTICMIMKKTTLSLGGEQQRKIQLYEILSSYLIIKRITMNSLNLDLIYKAKRLLNENHSTTINYSNGKLNELLRRHRLLFWETMHKCLNLNDLIHKQQITTLNHSYFILTTTTTTTNNNISDKTTTNITISNMQSLYKWCNYGRSTWFTNVFTLMCQYSWQEKVSIQLQQYLVPILLLINCLSLILSISGINKLCRLSNRFSQKVMILMRCQSVVQTYLPATWSLLLWYCIFGLLWLFLVLGLNILTLQYLNINISPHSHNFYCRTLTYLKSILRYIPAWLISLMLCDRAIGEYRNRHQIYAKTLIKSNDLQVNENDLEQQINVCIKHGTSMMTFRKKLSLPKLINNKTFINSNCQCQLNNLKMNLHYKSTYVNWKLCKKWLCCCQKSYFHCVFHGLKQTSTNQCKKLNILNDCITLNDDINVKYYSYEKLLHNICDWNECGLGRVGGLVLFSIVTALICLINTHLIWLYKIGKSTKRCILSAGDEYILSVFYPYLLQVCHSILPPILTFISLVLLTFTAIHKSHIFHVNLDYTDSNKTIVSKRSITMKSSLSNKIMQQSIFTEPTQLTICIGVVNILFDLGEFIEWIYAKFIIPNYIQLFTQNIKANFNVNDSILLTNSLNSSILLTESIKQMCSIQFIFGLLRIWSSQRYVFTLPILLYQSVKFRHLAKYYFQYYFQTLKMLYLCKISYKLHNHSNDIKHITLNKMINKNELINQKDEIITTTDNKNISSHDFHIHSYHPHQQQPHHHHHHQQQQQQQQQQLIIVKKEDKNEERVDNDEREHDEIHRIPSLYCCSCISQTILPIVVNKDEREINVKE